MTTVPIVYIVAFVPGRIRFKCFGSCQLHGTEHSAVDVAFHFQNPLYKLCVRSQHADTPSRHIVTFTHGVEFYTAFFGTRHTQDTDRLIVQDKAVRIVVHNHDVLAAGKLHQAFVQFRSSVGTGRHVRIVGPHQFHAAQIHLFQFIEVRHPSVFLFQVIVHHLGTQYFA